MRACGIRLLDQRVVGRLVLRDLIDEARVIPLDGLFLEEETASRALVVVLEALDHRQGKAFAPHLDAPVVEDLFQQLIVVETRDSGLYIGVLISSGNPPLGGPRAPPFLLPEEQRAIVGLTDFVVEAEKTARAHLKHLGVTTPIRELNLQTLNEHTDLKTLPELLKPLQEGRSMGIVSEAGCPAVADPGANLVALAHKHGFEVRPLVGPSSLLLALMASGANGQNFAFKGYLPSEKNERIQRLKALEQRSRQHNETQLFIETPYRNDALLADAVENLHPETRLCVATDLTLPTQEIISQTIAQWRKRKEMPNLKKRPTIFVLHAA